MATIDEHASRARDAISRAENEREEYLGLVAVAHALLALRKLDSGEAVPLCPVHEQIDKRGTLEMEISGLNCLACTLQERVELLALLAPFADGKKDSVTVLREAVEFYATHHGEGRVVVSYPATQDIKMGKIIPLYDERDNYNPQGRDVDPKFAAGWNAAADAVKTELEELQNAKDYIAESDTACQTTLKDLGLTWQHLGVPTTVDRLAREIKTLRAASYRSHTYEDAR